MARPSFQRDRLTILVVDDDPNQARVLQRSLENAGYRVVTAHSSDECREKIERSTPDLILLDVILGDEDGLALGREIKQQQRYQDTYLVYISGAKISADDQVRGLEMGAEGYLSRPIDKRELVARVDALMRLRLSEYELRSSEALWRTMFAASNDLMMVIDLDGNILYANPKALETYGYDKSELIGGSFFKLVPGRLKAAIVQEIDRVILSRSSFFESKHRTKWGEEFSVEVSLSHFEYQERSHLLTVVRDLRAREELVRDRLRLMQDVIFERERLNNIISSVPGVVWETWDKPDHEHQRINFVSDHVEQLLGYSVSEWLSVPSFWLTIVHPDDRERAASEVSAAYQNADPALQFSSQFRWRKKSGEVIWVEAQSRVIVDDTGRPIGMRGVTIDISRSKEVESQLTFQLEFNRAVNESMAEGLVIYDNEELVTYMNKAAEEVLGYELSELLGKSLHDMTHYQREDGTLISLEECALQIPLREQQRVRNLEETFIKKDGTRIPVLCSSAPIFASGRLIGAVLVFRDITELKQNEAEIRSLNGVLEKRVEERTAQLQMVNEQLVSINQELEAFSYSVSHDLRAPFRHIVGFSELLEKRSGAQLDETSRKYITTISEAAKYAGTLVDNLLSFSRIGRTKLRANSVSLEQLIEECRAALTIDIGHRTIEWKIETPLPKVKGDVNLLRVAFENVISNAIKYTRKNPNARIEIGIGSRTPTDVILFVRDNGVGFDMRYVAKLFGVFQRLHRSEDFEGTGIGLANVSRIIQRHGGKVWAESQPGKGATFFLQLPLAE